MAFLVRSSGGISGVDDFLQVGRTITRTLTTGRTLLSDRQHKSNYVRTTESNGVRRITLIHKKTNNAFSLSMMSSLLYSITEDIDDPKLRSIVVAAEPDIDFSSGFDVEELRPGTDEQFQRTVFDTCAQLMRAVVNSPVPVIAAVDGSAAGAGCELVASCDIALCTERSSFSTPGINYGIFCSLAGIPLMRNMSRKLATHMLFTGLPITGHEAFSAGLVTKVVPVESLEDEINKITNSIDEKSRSVIQFGKRFMQEQIETNVERAYSMGTEIMVENLKLRDTQECIKTIIEDEKSSMTQS